MYQISNEIIRFIEKTIETWKVELTAGGKSLTGENPKRDFPGRCIINMTICYHDDATHAIQLHTQENIQTDRNFVNRKKKNQSFNVHRRHQTVRQKRTRIGNPNLVCENIQTRSRNGIWHRKCAMLVVKTGKRHMTEGIEPPNQEELRTHKEKEMFKYLRILEANTI